MLPRELCEGVCSLLAGTDRLAVSVIWTITPEGRVKSTWFGRTVIRSCVKLTYQQAQQVIESGGSSGGLPGVESPHTPEMVAQVVIELHKLAQVLRADRFSGGALHLYQPKMCFNLDFTNGQPLGLVQDGAERQDSHHLVEEFMLLANMAAAELTYISYPDQCVLRRHPPPLRGPMESTLKALSTAGVHLNGTTAGSLQAGLANCHGEIALAVAALCSKPMQFARYFTPGGSGEGEGGDSPPHHHYALNVPRYTHFTSPIRRYADILVHRLLTATLSPPAPMPELAVDLVGRACEHCNDRKKAAKGVQEASSELYLGLLVRKLGEMYQPAIVVQILDRSFDALLLNLGLVRRVYTQNLNISGLDFTRTQGVNTLTLHWNKDASHSQRTQVVTLLAKVDVVLKPVNSTTLKFQTVLVRPE